MAKQKITFGMEVAYSVLPFMVSKHTCTRQELIPMVQSPVDRRLKEKDDIIRMLLKFQEFGTVTHKGLTWTKGVNEKGFYEMVQSYLEQ